MSVNLRRKNKALERALRKKFASLPPHFKFKVHDSFQDTYDSITLPAGYTKPTQSELETQYNTEITEEEDRPFTLIGGDLEVGTANLYVNTSTTRVGIGKRNPAYTLDVVGDVYATGNITGYSDRRAKEDIRKIENALEKIEKLNGYTYTMNDKRYTGLIAQEVLPVLPEAVTGSEETNYALAYGNMMGLIVEAIKELKQKIDK